MCAGAVREAVFSVPEVIRRINADFVPVSMAMASFQARAVDDEGKLLQSIYRSKAQPQGTCVLNSGGQVLAWTVMFDKNKSVLDFLDHGVKRFRDHPDAKEAIMTERYMKFPSAKLADMKDDAKPNPIADGHADGKHCPGWVDLPRGTIVSRVIGRALNKQGKFLGSVNQEHFALDRFTVTPETQNGLAKLFAGAGTGRVRLPDAFARQCVAAAYLGNKDMGPLVGVSAWGFKGDLKKCEFWAQQVVNAKASDDTAPLLFRVEGQSEVVGEGSTGVGKLLHEIKLTWDGYIEMKGDRVARLVIAARGTEKLQYGEKMKSLPIDEVAILAGGRHIDMECGVRYGIIGEPVADDKVKDRK